MSKSPTPQPTPEPAKKVRSPAILAANAFNRIATIDDDEAAELKQSPEAIRRKHAERRAKVTAALNGEAKIILDGMLATKAKAKEAAE